MKRAGLQKPRQARTRVRRGNRRLPVQRPGARRGHDRVRNPHVPLSTLYVYADHLESASGRSASVGRQRSAVVLPNVQATDGMATSAAHAQHRTSRPTASLQPLCCSVGRRLASRRSVTCPEGRRGSVGRLGPREATIPVVYAELGSRPTDTANASITSPFLHFPRMAFHVKRRDQSSNIATDKLRCCPPCQGSPDLIAPRFG